MPMIVPVALSYSAPPESPAWMLAFDLDHPGQLLGVAAVVVAGGDGLVQRGHRAGRGGRRATGATGVADRGHRGADRDRGRVAELGGGQAAGVLELDHRDVVGRVGADHGGGVGLAGADHGHRQAGGVLHHVVVGQDLAVGGQHHAGAGRLALAVVEHGVDVDDADLLSCAGRAGGAGTGRCFRCHCPNAVCRRCRRRPKAVPLPERVRLVRRVQRGLLRAVAVGVVDRQRDATDGQRGGHRGRDRSVQQPVRVLLAGHRWRRPVVAAPPAAGHRVARAVRADRVVAGTDGVTLAPGGSAVPYGPAVCGPA